MTLAQITGIESTISLCRYVQKSTEEMEQFIKRYQFYDK